MNKYLKPLVTFAFFAVLTSTVHAQAAWKQLLYADKQMAFSMPTNPIEQTQTTDSDVGTITIHEYLNETDTYILIVAMNSYPQVLDGPAQPRLEAARDANIKALGAKLTTQKNITLDGNPGIEFQCAGNDYLGKYRIYLVGKNLYQIGSVSYGGAALFTGTDRFLDSFRLVKP